MIPAYNQTRGVSLASRCEVADTFFRRFCGLQLRKELPRGCGLLLSPCNSIHMFFMRFPIDVLFLDDALKVVGMCEGIKPWRVSSIFSTAKKALELPAGTIQATGTEEGDVIIFEDPACGKE